MDRPQTLSRRITYGWLLAGLSITVSLIILGGESPWVGRVWALLTAVAAVMVLLWYLGLTGRLSVTAFDQCAWALLIGHTMLVYRSRPIQEIVQDSTPTPAILAEVGIWIVLLLYALFRMMNMPARIRLLSGPRTKYVTGLTVAAFASTFYALSPAITFAWSVKLLCIVSLSIVLFDPDDPLASVRRFIDASYWGLVMILAFFLVFSIVSPENAIGLNRRTGILRLGGNILPAVSLAAVAGLALLLSLTRILRSHRSSLTRWIFGGSAILLLSSLGRGGILGTVVSSLVSLFLFKRLRVAVALALCLTLLVAAFPSLIDSAYTLITRRQTSTELMSLTGRNVIWANSLEMISERPILGWGYVSGSRFGLSNSYLLAAAHSHNALLEIMISLGLVGAVLLFTVVGMTYFGMIRILRRPGTGDVRPIACELMCVLVFLSVIGLFTPSFADAPRFETALFIGIVFSTDILLASSRGKRIPASMASPGSPTRAPDMSDI